MSSKPRRCLAMVLAAGEGVRMKSARPKVAARDRRPVDARPCATRPWRAGAKISRSWSGPAATTSPPRPAKPRRRANLRPARAARDRPCRACGARGDRARLRRHPGHLWDTPLLRGATLKALRDGLAEGDALAALGFAPADPDRLRPPDRKGRPARRDPGAQGRDRRRSAAPASATQGRSPFAGSARPRPDRGGQRRRTPRRSSI